MDTINFFILSVSFLASLFLPSLYIKRLLGLLRNKNDDLKKYSKKYENEELRFCPARLGEAERMLFWIILFFSSYSQVITFFIAWVAIKTAINYKFWTGVKTKESHLGRALFCIYLIGNILSLISVIFIFALTEKIKLAN